MGNAAPSVEPSMGSVIPYTHGPCYHVIRPQPQGEVAGLCVNQAVYGCETHWDPMSSLKLMHLKEGCPHCKEFGKPRWYGYMPVRRRGYQGIELFEITAWAAIHCGEIMLGTADLRGKEIKVSRPSKGKQGRTAVKFSDGPAGVNLPPPVNLRPALLKLYGFVPEPVGMHADGEKGGPK